MYVCVVVRVCVCVCMCGVCMCGGGVGGGGGGGGGGWMGGCRASPGCRVHVQCRCWEEGENATLYVGVNGNVLCSLILVHRMSITCSLSKGQVHVHSLNAKVQGRMTNQKFAFYIVP